MGLSLPRGGFTAPINGFDMYCEVGGEGPLLVFLPGGLVGVDMQRPLVEAFRERFTVLSADGNGQGRSGLGPGPITYVSMAADLVSLLDRLGIEDADYFGLGDGGVCGLHLLVDFSHRVRSVSLGGAPYAHSAYTKFGRKFIESVAEQASAPTGFLKLFANAYATASPHPEQFEEMMRRLVRTWVSQPKFNRSILAEIDKPALIITSDRDEFISEDELRRLADWIPDAKVAHIPGMGHVPGVFQDVLVNVVAQFLREL